jgi:hypothetical protein
LNGVSANQKRKKVRDGSKLAGKSAISQSCTEITAKKSV